MAEEEAKKKEEENQQTEPAKLDMKKKKTSKKEVDKKLFLLYHPRPSLISKLWKLELQEGDDANEVQ